MEAQGCVHSCFLGSVPVVGKVDVGAVAVSS